MGKGPGNDGMGQVSCRGGSETASRLFGVGTFREGAVERSRCFVYRSGVSVNRRRAMSANRGDRD